MKVCTDSCLFGAWVAKKIERNEYTPKKILDIGTGTGVLSLMIAQKSSAHIDAVEINSNAYTQALENFTESRWNQTLQVFHADIKNWKAPHKYDLIISNPPFYENDLLPEDEQKSISKHNHALSLEDLLLSVQNLLNDEGCFAVLLPFSRAKWFERKALAYSFYSKECAEVKPSTNHNFFRVMFMFQKQNTICAQETISIKNENNNYTNEFVELMKDYYLHL